MKKTGFFQIHHQLGAKIVPFAGYEMPIQYTGIVEEHKKVRTAVGVFDVSHMGEFYVTGKNAGAFLQNITVNDVTKLTPGRVQYSAMCYEDGGIVDDLLVYQLSPEEYMVVVNAANLDKDFAWMKSHLQEGVSFIDRSDETSLLAIQGPFSEKTLQKLTSVRLSDIQYYHHAKGTVAGIDMIISRTGYTGELGYEIYFPAAHSEKIWNAVSDAGREFGIAPIGLGARDTLRLEMGYCLYGNDIDQSTNPIEAGLGWITRVGKGSFIGKTVIEKTKNEGLKRMLVGMQIEERAIPRHGYSIYKKNAAIGTVTSGCFSPSLEKGIAMGYVPKDLSTAGTELEIEIRGALKIANVVQLPFLKK
jgi:aminomethyltransferase